MIGRMTVARIVCLLAAVAVCGWFVLAIRASHDEDAVQALLASHRTLDAAQARSANAQLNAAAFLNPDEAIADLRTIVEARAGHRGRAIAIARATALAHPRDSNAWLMLQFVTQGVDPGLYKLGAARVRALVPPVVTAP
jgi:hypothetical protein